MIQNTTASTFSFPTLGYEEIVRGEGYKPLVDPWELTLPHRADDGELFPLEYLLEAEELPPARELRKKRLRPVRLREAG